MTKMPNFKGAKIQCESCQTSNIILLKVEFLVYFIQIPGILFEYIKKQCLEFLKDAEFAEYLGSISQLDVT